MPLKRLGPLPSSVRTLEPWLANTTYSHVGCLCHSQVKKIVLWFALGVCFVVRDLEQLPEAALVGFLWTLYPSLPLVLVGRHTVACCFVYVNKGCLSFLTCVIHIFPVVTFCKQKAYLMCFVFRGLFGSCFIDWLIGFRLLGAIGNCFVVACSVLIDIYLLLEFLPCVKGPSFLGF